MHTPKELLFFSLFSAILLLSGCAGQVLPSGGPPDTTPPTIIATVPDSNATHVTDNSVELEFSEYVDRGSVEESIFISPYVGELEFDWGTTDVTVRFSQKLKQNTTYVVNVGTDVKDIRAHNRMAAGYTLAFSTGDSIDHGSISGRVFDNKPEGVMIFAYSLKDCNPDTLDPGRVKPDYIMQTGKDGLFKLSNIALGRYRVLAVRDEFRNLLYDKQTDQYGVPVGDTVLTGEQPGVTDIWFRLSQEDTTKPFVTGANPVNNRLIRVRFNEPPDTVSFPGAVFTITDTLKAKTVSILLASLSRVLPSVVDLVTETTMDSGVAYRVAVRRIFDRSGNPIDTTNALSDFVGTERPDTVRPSASVPGIADSSRGIPLGRAFGVTFSEPVLPSAQNGVSLRDSGKTVVPATLRWINASEIQLVPVSQLLSNVWYQIRVVLDSVRDYAGNSWKDSTLVVRFRSLDLRSTGTVEGVVTDAWGKRGRGLVYVTASEIDASPPLEVTIQQPSPGSFMFDRLPEGKYVFSAFRDADSSGNYSYGRPYPFVPSERFTNGTDTVKVRARWGTEGVSLKFK